MSILKAFHKKTPMAKQGSMPSFKTVDDYIAVQSETVRQLLHELRDIIKEAVPESIEMSDAKVPSFMLVPGAKPALQLMFMAYAKGVSFYPFQAAVTHFADQLKGYEVGKGTVKFPFNQPLPKALIQQMVMFRKEEIVRGK